MKITNILGVNGVGKTSLAFCLFEQNPNNAVVFSNDLIKDGLRFLFPYLSIKEQNIIFSDWDEGIISTPLKKAKIHQIEQILSYRSKLNNIYMNYLSEKKYKYNLFIEGFFLPTIGQNIVITRSSDWFRKVFNERQKNRYNSIDKQKTEVYVRNSLDFQNKFLEILKSQGYSYESFESTKLSLENLGEKKDIFDPNDFFSFFCSSYSIDITKEKKEQFLLGFNYSRERLFS